MESVPFSRRLSPPLGRRQDTNAASPTYTRSQGLWGGRLQGGCHSAHKGVHKAQPWPFPSSLMIGCLAEATSTEITIDPTELADARWFTREEARQILESRHPQGINSPPRMAIANHILQAFVDAG